MNKPLTHYLPLRIAACAVAATCATAVWSQTTAGAPSGTASTTATTSADAEYGEHHHGALKHADRSFVEKAAESGRDEVEISRIAVERATNPDVKKFAQMMVDDHTRANEELTSLASTKGVKLKDKEKNENRWSKKDAKDFDRDYVKKMVTDHKKDIDLFTKESEHGADADLVDFARKTLPKLNKHLEAVNELEKTFR